MEDFKNCHYDPESDDPPKSRQGWWWVLALIVILGALVVWVKWPTEVETVPSEAEFAGAGKVQASLSGEDSVAKKVVSNVETEGDKETEESGEPITSIETQSANAKTPAEPKTDQNEPKPTVPAEPEYEFYTLLQKQEVIIPEEELEKHRPEAPTLKPGVYVLQVGSFRTQPQAARSRARLAKHGLEASIQQVTAKDDKVWFRVRIGPYIDPDELRATRETLIDLKIDSIPIRLR